MTEHAAGDNVPGQESQDTTPLNQSTEHHQQPHTSTSTTSPTIPTTESPIPDIPAAFPKKRRGRPPGRPNATVRDADYEDNALVQAWNAAKADRASPAVSIFIRDALTEQSLVHDTQRNIFRMPSRETILFVQGWITAKHIASQRPSYVNGLLIHSRGQDAAVACAQCAEKRSKYALGPFLSCRVLPGSYHNSCSNCKWFDNTSSCSLYTGPKPNRKRKAKEQLPPPPTTGVGPASDGDRPNGNSYGTSSTAGDQGSAPLEPKSHPQAQLQPEADMATPSTQPQPHAGMSGSELLETPSQPDSLTDSHYALRKPGQDEDAESADDGDADWQLNYCQSSNARIPRWEKAVNASRAQANIPPSAIS
ncbi:hypothetical protein CHGG_08021 [Chaetomium globosum CBS 148.51]|uniref:Uncharacterized protein n=1 Tax=Chaetomium globosum (strain ATCC 6205 / CBS 148.51 / DSM 1962 / NBRC 6347 / NRRL 1970) TaxID=306901 RepID=Q2GVI3_CHAGB|nr:uncharacterized protein CHGG_08021 [Chaetomium globosum CBS 148.51]EAQ86768.1 hypothetical protein CHGG_08021 [Chaetomium globosum CBS 148.51]